MPSVSRQKPPEKPLVQFPVGSMLGDAVSVTNLKEERIKICIYGRNRVGKTTLAAQFPKPLLFVSCEPAHCGGVQSISNMDGVKLITVEPQRGRGMTGREKMEAIGKELSETRHYQTVVLKTATSLQDLVMEEMKIEFPGIPTSGRGAKDTNQMRADRFHNALRPYLDLKHINVVILAQEKDHNPPFGEGGFPDLKAKLLRTMQQGSFMAPALGPANAQWLQDACAYVVQLYEDEVTEEAVIPMNNPDGTPAKPVIQQVGTGKRARHLRLQYHANFAAGGKWQYDARMPDFVTAPTPRGLYEQLAEYIPALG